MKELIRIHLFAYIFSLCQHSSVSVNVELKPVKSIPLLANENAQADFEQCQFIVGIPKNVLVRAVEVLHAIGHKSQFDIDAPNYKIAKYTVQACGQTTSAILYLAKIESFPIFWLQQISSEHWFAIYVQHYKLGRQCEICFLVGMNFVFSLGFQIAVDDSDSDFTDEFIPCDEY